MYILSVLSESPLKLPRAVDHQTEGSDNGQNNHDSVP